MSELFVPLYRREEFNCAACLQVAQSIVGTNSIWHVIVGSRISAASVSVVRILCAVPLSSTLHHTHLGPTAPLFYLYLINGLCNFTHLLTSDAVKHYKRVLSAHANPFPGTFHIELRRLASLTQWASIKLCPTPSLTSTSSSQEVWKSRSRINKSPW